MQELRAIGLYLYLSRMNGLTHLSHDGKAQMVDVSEKNPTKRIAVAEARVQLPDQVLTLLDGDEIKMPKGAVFQTAVLAGVMAAKKTSDLIPLCHPLPLDNMQIDIAMDGNEAVITSTATVHAKTGAEMEAMTAACLAALTIYDMCKAASHHITIKEVKLMRKTGGKNDFDRNA